MCRHPIKILLLGGVFCFSRVSAIFFGCFFGVTRIIFRAKPSKAGDQRSDKTGMSPLDGGRLPKERRGFVVQFTIISNRIRVANYAEGSSQMLRKWSPDLKATQRGLCLFASALVRFGVLLAPAAPAPRTCHPDLPRTSNSALLDQERRRSILSLPLRCSVCHLPLLPSFDHAGVCTVNCVRSSVGAHFSRAHGRSTSQRRRLAKTR